MDWQPVRAGVGMSAARPPLDPVMDALQTARVRSNVTVAELAAKAGINRGTLHRILNRASSPTIDTVRRIAGALGQDVVVVPNGDVA